MLSLVNYPGMLFQTSALFMMTPPAGFFSLRTPVEKDPMTGKLCLKLYAVECAK